MIYDEGVRCERCGDESRGGFTPTLAWLGRHAHGTQTVIYFRVWRTSTPHQMEEWRQP